MCTREARINAGYPTEPNITEHHSLEPPAEEMGQNKFVKKGGAEIKKHRLGVLGGVEAAIFAITPLGQRLAQLRIQVRKHLSCIVSGLEENEDQQTQIQHCHAHDDPPEHRMRTGEQSITHLYHRKYQEH